MKISTKMILTFCLFSLLMVSAWADEDSQGKLEKVAQEFRKNQNGDGGHEEEMDSSSESEEERAKVTKALKSAEGELKPKALPGVNASKRVSS